MTAHVQIDIRPLKAVEVFAVADFLARTFNVAAQDSVARLGAAIKQPTKTLCLTASVDGKFAGVVTAFEIDDLALQKTLSHTFHEYRGKIVYIEGLAVAEGLRNQGVGRALMRGIEEQATAIWNADGSKEGYFYLNQDPQGVSGRKPFYQKSGYVLVDPCAPGHGQQTFVKPF